MKQHEVKPRVLMCVCGGIAAYKAVEVLRLLQKAGCEVKVIASEDSLRFVGASTWEGLTHEVVAASLYDYPASRIPHVELAGWADVVLVVPATANILAKMRMGLADDLISSALLAVPAETPVVIAPAMNVNMWQNPATQDNVRTLEDRGYEFVFPVEGRLACDYVGEGKLATIDEIADAVSDALEDDRSDEDRTLAGLTVLVTAGPTHEAIDPVRYIANASSGKMGFALAEEAARMGARVTLVAGPVSLETPAGVDRIDVVSAQDMYEATTEAFRDVDIAICAAAVADYTPKAASDHKLKKATEHLDAIELVETKDILKTLCETKGEGGRTRIVCGFAAETNDLIEHAQDKLRSKNCDLIVANDVSRSDSTFGSDTNHVTLITPAGPIELPTMPKGEVASRILAFLAGMAQAAGQMRS